MPHTLEIDNDIYEALVASFGEKALKEKTDDILLSAIESLIEKYTREVLRLEEKYGVSFKDFEQMWDKGEIKDRHSHEVESDFMDWEMLGMEKKDLLSVMSKLKGFKGK